MASCNRRNPHVRPEVPLIQPRYFIIAITNFPHLLRGTRPLQELTSSYPPPPPPHPQYGNDMHPPNGPMSVNRYPSEDPQERMLYNTLRQELQEVIQGYLQRTRLPYPICLVLDFSGVPPPRL